MPAEDSSSSASRVAASVSAPAASARLEQAPPGAPGQLARRAPPASRQRSASELAQLAARSREQEAGAVEVAGGEARGGGDLVRVAGAGERPASIAAAGSGAKSTGWQREATVSSSASGSELSRIRWTKSGRLLERLQQGVLALVAHRLGGLDDEDALAALEGPVGGGADHPLADLLDQVLGAARRQPDEVGMRRGVEQGAAARVVGVLGPGGEDLRREGARRGPLAGPARAAEEVGVGGPGARARRSSATRARGWCSVASSQCERLGGALTHDASITRRVDLLDACRRRRPRRPGRRRSGAISS